MATKSLEHAVELADQHRAAGRLADAEAMYRKALLKNPNCAPALHGSGILQHLSGNHAAAVELLRRAVAGAPGDASYQSNFGAVLLAAGQLPQAIAAFSRAVAIQPDFPNGHYNLANALKQNGQRDQAIAAYRRAIELDPNHFQALSNLGHLLLDADKKEEAIELFRRAVVLRKELPEAHTNLALAMKRNKAAADALRGFRYVLSIQPDNVQAMGEVGEALMDEKKYDEAEALFAKALSLEPNSAATNLHMGSVFSARKQFDQSAIHFRRAMEIDPLLPETQSNMGSVYSREKKVDLAIAHYRRALELRPSLADVEGNLAGLLNETGDFEEAFRLYRHAIELEPESSDAHMNLAFALLARGEFREGWREYEWRWKDKKSPRWEMADRQWKGEPLDGRPILIRSEQGLGDSIQFLRYVPMVSQLGGRIALAVPAPLHELCRNLPGVERVVNRYEDALPCDIQVALLSLPFAFGTTLETVPAQVPYLRPDPQSVEKWRARLGDDPRKKIGLVWAGNPDQADDQTRSIPLAAYAPLGRFPGLRFISLQKGVGAPQAKNPPPELQLIDWTEELTDFAQTAALISNLDLVITIDTSVAHLTGAVGQRGWVLKSTGPDFRWIPGREVSPWYPTLRVFHQTKYRDWAGPLERLEREMEKQAAIWREQP